ncbi:MurR/RpiR family transcriptional regulator [Nocardioides aquiterrae]|uniref:MurR/RpiR family transcriptional regulator n=1 Tax=Nocardioides aquiterrae TaxID=203799 RepID=A0ABN1UNJ2_9ACTN
MTGPPSSVAELTAASLPSLSPAERRVGRALLADYPSAGLGSAARLAERASVSAPSVLRFAQTLGFEGFADLQSALRAELSARSNGPLTRLADAPSAGSTLARMVDQGRAQNDAALSSIAGLSESSVDAAVALVADPARRVFLHGGRFSHLLAIYFAGHLEQLRTGVRLLEHPFGRDLGITVDLGRRDVLVLFDFHRYQRSAVELADRARKAGTATVLITDDMACPAAPEAAVVLVAASTVNSTYQSMAGGFLLTELLLPPVMDAIGEPARTRMALWEQHRSNELVP